MERKKVVLADDVELFLMLENTFFNRDEFEMITARGGEEVLKIIKASNPDIVFINLEMPEIPGDECCRILKSDESFSHIPIVIVSPTDRSEELKRCRVSGCDDVITKPIRRKEFMDASRRFLTVTERGDKRIPVNVAVKFGVISGDIQSDYSVDINAGGLFLATDRLQAEGTLLHLEFILPDSGTSIKCLAKVAWVNGHDNRKKPQLPIGMGVRFLNLSESEIAAIGESIGNGT
jgi:uncharacterized protein (TIGR02266 family)